MPASGPHPGKTSASTFPYSRNLAGSPTITTLSHAVPTMASARSSKVWPSNSKKALSTPMRELFPPASTKPIRVGLVGGIWKSIRHRRSYTKVTYPERPSRRKMNTFDLVGGTGRHHAAKTHGCSHAGTLFARIFMATPRGQRRVLPGLPAMRDRLPVRLEVHASRKQSRRTARGYYHRPAPLRPEAADLDAPGATLALEHSGSVSRQKPQHLVRRPHPEHQPVRCSVSRTTAVTGECAGGTDF